MDITRKNLDDLNAVVEVNIRDMYLGTGLGYKQSDVKYIIDKVIKRNSLVHDIPFSKARRKLLDENVIAATKEHALTEIKKYQTEKEKIKKLLESFRVDEEMLTDYNKFLNLGFYQHPPVSFYQNSDFTPLEWDDILREIHDFNENNDRLSSNLKLLKQINKIQSNLRANANRFKRNEREIFRKINSFFFKNMDDYHSALFTNVN